MRIGFDLACDLTAILLSVMLRTHARLSRAVSHSRPIQQITSHKEFAMTTDFDTVICGCKAMFAALQCVGRYDIRAALMVKQC